MRITVLGSDERFECLREMLGRAEPAGELVITPWPSPAAVDESSVVVTCGPRRGPEWAVDLLADEEYQRDIARMTAEGAVSAAMRSARGTIFGAECLVAGWGRIGRALTEILVGLGARVTVLSRRQESRPEIAALGGAWADTGSAERAAAGKSIVFSTAPAMIFDGPALAKLRRGALVIDLASPPYGVDLAAAEKLGLNAWREPALPGRYCPEAAAAAIFRALVRGGYVKEAVGNG